MSDDGDDPSFDIGDVYGGEAVESGEPAKKKKKMGFGFKFPQFLKREKKSEPEPKKDSSDLDCEEDYKGGDRLSRTSNPMTAESIHAQPHTLPSHPSSELSFGAVYDRAGDVQFINPSRERAATPPPGAGLPTVMSTPPPPPGAWQQRPSREMNFAQAYEKPPPLQFADNPGKSTPLRKPSLTERTRGASPPPPSKWEQRPSGEINFAQAYDKPLPLQFSDNPAKSAPLRKPSLTERTTPPRNKWEQRPSGEINFSQAYDKPLPLQLADNPARKKTVKVTPPRRGSSRDSTPSSTPPSNSFNKGATPPRSALRNKSSDMDYGEVFEKKPPGPLQLQENPVRYNKNTSVSFSSDKPTADFAFLVKENVIPTGMDEELGNRLPTKVKPTIVEKPKTSKGSLNAFFGLFRASRKPAKDINRSESAALERLKSASQQSPVVEKPVIVITPSAPDDRSANSHVYFDVNDPNSPILISMKENMKIQANRTIAFAPRSAFDQSILLSLELIAVARSNYVNSGAEFKRTQGIHLAGLLESLGDIYKSIGNFLEAIKCLTEALATRRDVKSGAQQMAAAFNDLGLVYCEVAKYEDARDCFEQSLKILLGYHEDGKHPDIASTLGNMSVCLRGMNNIYESVNAGEKAVKLMEEVCGRKDINTLQQKVLISLSLLIAGDPKLSVRTLADVINVAENKLGLDRSHPWLDLVYHEHRKALILKNENPEGSSFSDE